MYTKYCKDILSKYYNEWKLGVNMKKTNVMFFSQSTNNEMNMFFTLIITL